MAPPAGLAFRPIDLRASKDFDHRGVRHFKKSSDGGFAKKKKWWTSRSKRQQPWRRRDFPCRVAASGSGQREAYLAFARVARLAPFHQLSPQSVAVRAHKSLSNAIESMLRRTTNHGVADLRI